MIATHPPSWQVAARTAAPVLARWVVGAVFLGMGLSKVLQPVEFLKLVRQYDMVDSHRMLNLIAAGLPWLEVFCGLLMMAGIAVRGSALVLAAMLAGFTAGIVKRALAIHAGGGIPFCAIRFDCGCGGGEVFGCRKLAENSLLILLAAATVCSRSRTLCLWHSPFNSD
jgi:uncharacterized membrane protein YphA (DoxX/SURF4 family)